MAAYCAQVRPYDTGAIHGSSRSALVGLLVGLLLNDRPGLGLRPTLLLRVRARVLVPVAGRVPSLPALRALKSAELVHHSRHLLDLLLAELLELLRACRLTNVDEFQERWGSVSGVSDGRCTPLPRKLETEMEPD